MTYSLGWRVSVSSVPSGVRARPRTSQGFTGSGSPSAGGCYFDRGRTAATRFRTSVGDTSIGRGRGCALAMCVERRLVETCSPQNLQRALPGEMWTRCIQRKDEWPSPSASSRAAFGAQRPRDRTDAHVNGYNHSHT